VDTVGRIEKLFVDTAVVEISDSVKLRAAQRAIDKRAPFRRQRRQREQNAAKTTAALGMILSGG
jgi:hypothetical protein